MFKLTYMKVPNSIFKFWDLAYLKAGIQDSGERGERDSGL